MGSCLVKDGYLEARLLEHEAVEFVLAVQQRIRAMIPVLDDPMPPSGMEGVSRLARMGYEASTYGTLSSLDREDVALLRSLRLGRCDSLLAGVLKVDPGALRSSGDVALSGDHYAKDVSAVLSS